MNNIENIALAYWHQRNLVILNEEREHIAQQLQIELDAEKAACYQRQLTHIQKNQRRLRHTALTALPATLDDRFDAVAKELTEIYDDEADALITLVEIDDAMLSPRHRFLRKRYKALYKLRKAINDNAQGLLTKDATEYKAGEKRSPLRAFFDITKKIVDILDDAWAMIRSVIPPFIFNLVAPFLTSGVGFIIHLFESYQGIKEARQAHRHKTIGQRKTRLAVGITTAIIGITGALLAITLLAGALGAAVTGMGALFVLVPGFLTGIYAISLCKRSYILSQAVVNQRLTNLALTKSNNQLSRYHKNQTVVSNDDFALCEHQCALLKQDYEFARTERLKAERSFAFNSIEVFASVVVLTGTILSTTALFTAATIATFGAAPIALLVTGVLIGLLCKACDYFNEKKNGAYTNKIRNWFTGLGDRLLHKNIHAPVFFDKNQKHLHTSGRVLKRVNFSTAEQITPSKQSAKPQPRTTKRISINAAKLSHRGSWSKPPASPPAADQRYLSPIPLQ